MSLRSYDHFKSSVPWLTMKPRARDGDRIWKRIIRDKRPRPAFSALIEGVQAEFKRDPTTFPELSEEEFDRNSTAPNAPKAFRGERGG